MSLIPPVTQAQQSNFMADFLSGRPRVVPVSVEYDEQTGNFVEAIAPFTFTGMEMSAHTNRAALVATRSTLSVTVNNKL